MRTAVRWGAIAAVLIAGFAVLYSYGALAPCSAALDLGVLLFAFGALSVLYPLRFLDIRSRKAGAVVLLTGLVVAVAAINWPAPLERSEGRAGKLDEFLPSYQFNEVHSLRIHASPAKVQEALRLVTFSEVRLFAGLVAARSFALGEFKNGYRVTQLIVSGDLTKLKSPPILESMLRPGSGFLPLTGMDEPEVVLGLAGQFWANRPARGIVTAQDFKAFEAPASAKSAFNFRVEDLGGGWSRLTTETRVRGTDEAGRRALARYWRFIFPGSAAIRTMWLRAIRERAERA